MPPRGFTLIELMVVVVIIAVLAVLALPTITNRMRDRRAIQAAHEISALYRNARMRALGRGSAVLVSYGPGGFQARESIRGGADPSCAPLPLSDCLTANWTAGAPGNQLVAQFNPATHPGMQDVRVQMWDGAVENTLDICFTPMGRALWRNAPGNLLLPLRLVPEVRVTRVDGDGNQLGLLRSVLLLPNGNARLGVSRVAP